MPLPPFCATPASSSPSRLCSVVESVPSTAVSASRWPTLPWAFDPLQDPSFERYRLSPMNLDGRPVRFRGSVSVPIVPASTSAIAAPLSEHRRREASRSGVRVAPVSPSSPRSLAVRAAEHSKRRARGASRASRASRIVTDAGRPCIPRGVRVESMLPSPSTGPSAATVGYPKVSFRASASTHRRCR